MPGPNSRPPTAAAIAITLLLLGTLQANAQITLPDYFHRAYSNHEEQYQAVTDHEIRQWRRHLDLPIDEQGAIDPALEIHFLHDLFTGAGASDCVSGGVLGIPYFWHWVEPNPRHSLISPSDGVPLTKIPPPSGFTRYKSLADLDRTPVIYLADLVTISPRYQHPGCGSFHTFGWCSEREMAFCALVTQLGFDCKIKQQGIHTWTEVLVSEETTTGEQAHVVLKVDNTFDSVSWFLADDPQAWRSDFGDGSEVVWYNNTAHSTETQRALARISVPPEAASRIDELISSWLDSTAQHATQGSSGPLEDPDAPGQSRQPGTAEGRPRTVVAVLAALFLPALLAFWLARDR